MNNVNYAHVWLAGMRCVIMNTVHVPFLRKLSRSTGVQVGGFFQTLPLSINYYAIITVVTHIYMHCILEFALNFVSNYLRIIILAKKWAKE